MQLKATIVRDTGSFSAIVLALALNNSLKAKDILSLRPTKAYQFASIATLGLCFASTA